MVKIAVIGDIHRHISTFDVRYFNQSDYDLILVVGDLANWWPREALEVATHLARIDKPVLYIAGNHDTVLPFQLLAEVKSMRRFAWFFSAGHIRRAERLRERLGPVIWSGYSTHNFTVRDFSFDVIAGRPLAMGGPRLNYNAYLNKCYGVSTLVESAARLRQCVRESPSDNLLIFAHNGPSGLGLGKNDIWGCDFKPEAGDCGDPDLEETISFARQSGKRVLAVVAGHMHLELKGGGQRRWTLEQDDTVYLNAAEVPRIFRESGRLVHHHVGLEIGPGGVSVSRRLIERLPIPK